MRTSKLLRLGAMAILVGFLCVAGVSAQGPPTVDGLLDQEVYDFLEYYDVEPAGEQWPAPGTMYRYEGDDYCYYAFVVDTDHSDNVYAESDQAYLQEAGWNYPTEVSGHEFGSLVGSDDMVFNIECDVSATRTETYDGVKLDYLDDCDGQPGVYFEGVSSYEAGTSADKSCGDDVNEPIHDVSTSLYWNMTSSGWNGCAPEPEYNCDRESHSPPFDYNQTSGSYWEWRMIYEFSVPKFSPDKCCTVTQARAHVSGSKDGGTDWHQDPTAVRLASFAASGRIMLLTLPLALALALGTAGLLWVTRRHT